MRNDFVRKDNLLSERTRFISLFAEQLGSLICLHIFHSVRLGGIRRPFVSLKDTMFAVHTSANEV